MSFPPLSHLFPVISLSRKRGTLLWSCGERGSKDSGLVVINTRAAIVFTFSPSLARVLGHSRARTHLRITFESRVTFDSEPLTAREGSFQNILEHSLILPSLFSRSRTVETRTKEGKRSYLFGPKPVWEEKRRNGM